MAGIIVVIFFLSSHRVNDINWQMLIVMKINVKPLKMSQYQHLGPLLNVGREAAVCGRIIKDENRASLSIIVAGGHVPG